MADIPLNFIANQTVLQKSIEQSVGNIQRILASSNKLSLNLNVNHAESFRPLGRITGDLKDFERSMAAANVRVIAFAASTAALRGIIGGFQAIASAGIEVEKTLTDINRVLLKSGPGIQEFGRQLFQTARDTSSSFETASKAALEFSRQGLSVEDTLKRTRAALILVRLTGLDATTAVESLTATANGFAEANLSMEESLNKVVAVEQAFAVSARDLTEALSRSGQAAQAVGVNFDEFNALVTAAQQITARGGSVIGNALKTIFTRLEKSETLDNLEQFNISVRDIQGNILPGIKILDNMAETFKTLSDSQKSFLSQQVAGVYQANIFKSILSSLSKENGTFSQALEKGKNATNEASVANERLNQTLSALFQQLGTSTQEFAANVSQISFVPFATDYVKKITELVTFTNDVLQGDGIGSNFAQGILKGISNVLQGPGILGALFLVGKTIQKAFEVLSATLPTLAGITTESQKRELVESAVLSVLQSQTKEGNELRSLTGNLAAQEAYLLELSAARTAQMRLQNELAAQLTGNLLKQGVSATTSAGLKFGGKIPNLAIDPLQDAIQREVRAGYSVNQVRIGYDARLKGGIGVYNTTEGSLSNAINMHMIGNAALGKMQQKIPNFAEFDITGQKVTGPGGRAISFTKLNQVINDLAISLGGFEENAFVLNNKIRAALGPLKLSAESMNIVAKSALAFIRSTNNNNPNPYLSAHRIPEPGLQTSFGASEPNIYLQTATNILTQERIRRRLQAEDEIGRTIPSTIGNVDDGGIVERSKRRLRAEEEVRRYYGVPLAPRPPLGVGPANNIDKIGEAFGRFFKKVNAVFDSSNAHLGLLLGAPILGGLTAQAIGGNTPREQLSYAQRFGVSAANNVGTLVGQGAFVGSLASSIIPGGTVIGAGVGALSGFVLALNDAKLGLEDLGKISENFSQQTQETLSGASRYIQSQQNFGQAISNGANASELDRALSAVTRSFNEIKDINLQEAFAKAGGNIQLMSKALEDFTNNNLKKQAFLDIPNSVQGVLKTNQREGLSKLFIGDKKIPQNLRQNSLGGLSSTLKRAGFSLEDIQELFGGSDFSRFEKEISDPVRSPFFRGDLNNTISAIKSSFQSSFRKNFINISDRKNLDIPSEQQEAIAKSFNELLTNPDNLKEFVNRAKDTFANSEFSESIAKVQKAASSSFVSIFQQIENAIKDADLITQGIFDKRENTQKLKSAIIDFQSSFSDSIDNFLNQNLPKELQTGLAARSASSKAAFGFENLLTSKESFNIDQTRGLRTFLSEQEKSLTQVFKDLTQGSEGNAQLFQDDILPLIKSGNLSGLNVESIQNLLLNKLDTRIRSTALEAGVSLSGSGEQQINQVKSAFSSAGSQNQKALLGQLAQQIQDRISTSDFFKTPGSSKRVEGALRNAEQDTKNFEAKQAQETVLFNTQQTNAKLRIAFEESYGRLKAEEDAKALERLYEQNRAAATLVNNQRIAESLSKAKISGFDRQLSNPFAEYGLGASARVARQGLIEQNKIDAQFAAQQQALTADIEVRRLDILAQEKTTQANIELARAVIDNTIAQTKDPNAIATLTAQRNALPSASQISKDTEQKLLLLDQESKTKEESLKIEKQITQQNKAQTDLVAKTGATFTGNLKAGFGNLNSQSDKIINQLGYNLPTLLSDGLANALTAAMKDAKSLGDLLKDAGINFAQEISNALLKASFQKIIGSTFGTVLGQQSGGIIKAQNGMYISGGRTGDKNPALLEDGEYVLNREAVRRMGGKQALDYLNFSLAPRFASGGGYDLSFVQYTDEERKRLKKDSSLIANGKSIPVNFDLFSGRAFEEDEGFQRARSQAIEREQKRIQKAFNSQLKTAQLVSGIVGAIGSGFLAAGLSGLSSQAALGAQAKAANPELYKGVSDLRAGQRALNFNSLYSTGGSRLSQINRVSALYSQSGTPVPIGGGSIFGYTGSYVLGSAGEIVRRRQGGGYMSFDKGGYLPYGSRLTDTIPAMLKGGEFMVNPSSTAKYGLGMLNSVNNGTYRGGTGNSNTTNNNNSAFNLSVNIDNKGNTIVGESGSSYEQKDIELSKKLVSQIVSIARITIKDEQRFGGVINRNTR